MARVIIKHLSGTRTADVDEFPFDSLSEILIGRDASANIKYDPVQETSVSSKHASIKPNPQSLYQFNIIDHNSRNGTYVNRSRINGISTLNPGDIVQLGIGGPEFLFEVAVDKPSSILDQHTELSTNIAPPTRVAAGPSSTLVYKNDQIVAVKEKLLLKHLNGSRAEQIDEIPLTNFVELTIGRDPSSTVKFVSGYNDLVSARHAKIQRDINVDKEFLIVDLNSRNGTFVNKQRITTATRLQPGDIITLGSNGPEFQFLLDPQPFSTKDSHLPATRVENSSAKAIALAKENVPVGQSTVIRLISKAKSDTRKNLLIITGIAITFVTIASLILAVLVGYLSYKASKYELEAVAPLPPDAIARLSKSVVYIEVGWRLTDGNGQLLYQRVFFKCFQR